MPNRQQAFIWTNYDLDYYWHIITTRAQWIKSQHWEDIFLFQCGQYILSREHDDVMKKLSVMITSSNENIFRVTGHLCGEFAGHQWIPCTKASDAELWCFCLICLNKRLSKQSWGWWLETPLSPLWRHCNGIAGALVIAILVINMFLTNGRIFSDLKCTNPHWYRCN